MSHTDIYSRIKWILLTNFVVNEQINCYHAHFQNDLGLDGWDVNFLIFLVEGYFDIELNNGIDQELKKMNQLVSLVCDKLDEKLIEKPLAIQLAS